MARRFGAAVAACAVLAVGCGGNGADEDLSESFESPVYGYSLDYPDGWSAIPARHVLRPASAPLLGRDGTDVIAGRAARTVRDMGLPAVVVGGQPIEPGTALDDWTAEVEAIVAGFKGCAEPAEVDDVEIDGAPAAMLVYPDCPAGLGFDHLWAVFVHDDRGFQIVWFDESGDGPVEREEFEQILSTLSFPQ